MALDLLTAAQGGTCAIIKVDCCIYISDLSGNVSTAFSSVQFSLVTQSCPTLCDPMNRSTPGLPVHHKLLESTQIHAHQVGDAISSFVIPFFSCPQPPHPQHQGLFE